MHFVSLIYNSLLVRLLLCYTTAVFILDFPSCYTYTCAHQYASVHSHCVSIRFNHVIQQPHLQYVAIQLREVIQPCSVNRNVMSVTSVKLLVPYKRAWANNRRMSARTASLLCALEMSTQLIMHLLLSSSSVMTCPTSCKPLTYVHACVVPSPLHAAFMYTSRMKYEPTYCACTHSQCKRRGETVTYTVQEHS